MGPRYREEGMKYFFLAAAGGTLFGAGLGGAGFGVALAGVLLGLAALFGMIEEKR